MKVVNAAEMREIDRIAIEERGIPGVVLMGYAGRAIADYVEESLPDIGSIAVFAGTGNNGGDGFVAAYLLSNSGRMVDIFLCGDKEKISETSLVYYTMCRHAGVDIKENFSIEDLDLQGYDLVLDAIAGTGWSGAPRGIVADVIRIINQNSPLTLAVDMPSGLSADGEAPHEEAIIADITVTFGLPKISQVTYPGAVFCGPLAVCDIGFPADLTSSDALKTELISDDYVSHTLNHPCDPDIYKSARGHLLLIGGFEGMEGAIMLAAQAALETGVGMISLLTTEKSRVVIAGKIPELITHGIPDGLAEKGIAAYIDDFFRTHRCDALVIGPGMGRSNAACTVFNHILLMANNYNLKHILIDGDGLFHLADFLKENDLDDRIDFLITPHFFEASRILGKDVAELKMNRLHSARELSRTTASVALLKGPNSIVTDGEYALINTTGNESLATAGSGDVLSGIIGSLMLRQETALEAASIGVYVHGKAADMFCSEHETDVLKAGDLVGYIRKVQSSAACDCGGHDH